MWRFLIFVLLCTGVANAQSNIPVPDGYVLQQLEPTGGQIARPKDWLYHHQPTQSGWIWAMSAEDPKGKFETGWQGQTLLGVEKITKRPRQEFALNFLKEKQGSGRVLRECPTTDQGAFRTTCLETIEGKKRFIYSVFWGTQQLDAVIIATFGAPENTWDQVAPIADTLSNFQPMSAEFIERVKSNR